MFNKIKRLYRRLFKNPPSYSIEYLTKIERHGSNYGGWNIIPDSLSPDSKIISVGIGEDITFDLSIIHKYNCNVFAYDPTPKVKQFLKNQELPPNFIYHNIAIGDCDGKLVFFPPDNKDNVSHTAIKRNNDSGVEVVSNKLSTIMSRHGFSEIDLLKIDIEGFEYSVIDNIINENVKIKQLLVEFHHFFPEIGNHKTEEYLNKLSDNNFKLFNVADSFCEFAFINQNIN